MKQRELVIAVDTREQRPIHYLDGREISKGVTVRYESIPLYVFDYACKCSMEPSLSLIHI